jgi:hypothetical protein
MCAKTHTKYRNARNSLPEKSGFLPKKAYFDRKMAENTGKKAGNSHNRGSGNGSIRPLQIARKQGGTMIP